MPPLPAKPGCTRGVGFRADSRQLERRVIGRATTLVDPEHVVDYDQKSVAPLLEGFSWIPESGWRRDARFSDRLTDRPNRPHDERLCRSNMIVREPVVAGRFYAAHPDRCLAELAELLAQSWSLNPNAAPKRLRGGIVPHAGWAFSGGVAAQVFRALAASHKPTVIILFGSVHRFRGRKAALFSSGRWETPIGPVMVDSRLAERILGHTNQIADDVYAHEDEHSIEVQMPFIRHLFPDVPVLPIMVPPEPSAHEIGEAVARTLDVYQYDALIVGTTDLTHYGPRYGFAPQGVGHEGNAWAKQVNDQRFLDLVCDLRASELVAEARVHHNACSAGAVAATIRCVVALGATEATVLTHTSSSEVAELLSMGAQEDSVGYAGIVFE